MKTIGYLEISTNSSPSGNLKSSTENSKITTTTTTISVTSTCSLFSLKLIGILLFFGLPSIFAFFVSQRFTHPPWYYETARTPQQGLNYGYGSVNWMTFRNNPLKDHNYTFQEIEFEGPYNSILRGWYIPAEESFNSSRGIVGVHGAGMDRREFLKQAPILHLAGYNILLFDCREHGISTGSFKGFSYGIREHQDVIYAVRYMKNIKKMEKIAVVGTSQGATSTILAASKENSIDAVVVENPFTSVDDLLTDVINGLLSSKPEWTNEAGGLASYLVSFGDFIPSWYRTFLKYVTIYKIVYTTNEGQFINPIDVISKIEKPVFLIHGTADSLIPLKHTERLFERATEPKELWVADGCEHAAIYNRYPKEYSEKITAFLNRHL